MTRSGPHTATDTVFATRALRIEGTWRRAIATVYAPRLVRVDEWACAYRVTGMRVALEAPGGDSMQALTNALQGLRAYLDGSRLRYTWIGGEPGNHGFEHTIPTVFTIAHARRMARLVDHETTKFVHRELRRRRARRR